MTTVHPQAAVPEPLDPIRDLARRFGDQAASAARLLAAEQSPALTLLRTRLADLHWLASFFGVSVPANLHEIVEQHVTATLGKIP